MTTTATLVPLLVRGAEFSDVGKGRSGGRMARRGWGGGVRRTAETVNTTLVQESGRSSGALESPRMIEAASRVVLGNGGGGSFSI